MGRNLTLTQHHFLWDHSVTSSIKGTVAMPFSQWISNWRSHSLPEWGLEELKQGANTSLCVRPRFCSHPLIHLQKQPTNPPPPLHQRIQIGQNLENTALLPFHGGLYDCKVFYFPLKQCFYEMPQIKKSKWGQHLTSKCNMKDGLGRTLRRLSQVPNRFELSLEWRSSKKISLQVSSHKS